MVSDCMGSEAGTCFEAADTYSGAVGRQIAEQVAGKQAVELAVDTLVAVELAADTLVADKLVADKLVAGKLVADK